MSPTASDHVTKSATARVVVRGFSPAVSGRPEGLHYERRQLCSVLMVLALTFGAFPAWAGLFGEQIKPAPGSTMVLAGGCFWGVEAVFEHVRGVQSATSGYARYANPPSPVPIEAVRIVYDSSRVTEHSLLEIFFLVAHDPTTRDRQGPDSGPEYRAVVFFQNAAEREATDAYVAELNQTRRFSRPIVTEVRALLGFKVAEAFHQDYGARHPMDPYIVQNDAPKLVRLQQRFPALYRTERAP